MSEEYGGCDGIGRLVESCCGRMFSIFESKLSERPDGVALVAGCSSPNDSACSSDYRGRISFLLLQISMISSAVPISSRSLFSTHPQTPPALSANTSISALTANMSITCSSLLHSFSSPSPSRSGLSSILIAFFLSLMVSCSNPSFIPPVVPSRSSRL